MEWKYETGGHFWLKIPTSAIRNLWVNTAHIVGIAEYPTTGNYYLEVVGIGNVHIPQDQVNEVLEFLGLKK